MLRDTKTVKGMGLIECRTDEYFKFRTPAPSRIGDIAEIEVGKATFGSPSRVTRVIWLEAEDGTRWLVELKRRPAFRCGTMSRRRIVRR